MKHTIGAYITRRGGKVLLTAVFTGFAAAVVFVFGFLFAANPTTQQFLDARSQKWVEVAGRISAQQIGETVLEADVEIIPATVSYLAHPLLGGRSALLPVYGLDEKHAQSLLQYTGSTLRAERVVPGVEGVYLPAVYLDAVGISVGSEFTSSGAYQQPSRFTVEGIIESEIPFGLAAPDTIANLPIQEQVLIVYSSSLTLEELEASLLAAFQEDDNVRILGPSHYAQLNQERWREYRLLLPLVLVAGLVALAVGFRLSALEQRTQIATEQALAQLYFHSRWPSLLRPLVVAAISGVSGGLGGLLVGGGAALGLEGLWLSSQGIVSTLPWSAALAGLCLAVAPAAAVLSVWMQATKIDLFTFLGQVQQIKKAGTAAKSTHPSSPGVPPATGLRL